MLKLNFHLYVIKLCEVRWKLDRNNEPDMLFPLFLLCRYLKNKAKPQTKYLWKGSCSV